jgi:hypothetical protein
MTIKRVSYAVAAAIAILTATSLITGQAAELLRKALPFVQ